MAGKLDRAAEDFFSSDTGKKLAGRRDELERLAAGSDGQQVKKMLEKRDLGSALSSGDTETLKNALNDVMKTEAGARILSRLQDMLGKK